MTGHIQKSGHQPLVRLIATVVAATALLIGLAGPAAAADVAVDAPDTVTVGTEIEVTAIVTDAGTPVVGATATLEFVGKIAGKSGWAILDTGVTDDSGSVTFSYEQAALQGERMRVAYVDSDGNKGNSGFEVTVIDGAQRHSSSAGVDLGIVGRWWLLVVLAIIWTLVILAAIGILKIGRESDHEDGLHRILPVFSVAIVAFTALGMFYVVLSRPTMHANLDPTADFSRVPPALVGTDYDYVGLSNESHLADRSGDTGQKLFIQANCAGCHGLNGEGGVVGPALVEADEPNGISLDSFIGEVRDGPKEMPTYSETRLTDAEITLMHDFLYGPATN